MTSNSKQPALTAFVPIRTMASISNQSFQGTAYLDNDFKFNTAGADGFRANSDNGFYFKPVITKALLIWNMTSNSKQPALTAFAPIRTIGFYFKPVIPRHCQFGL